MSNLRVYLIVTVMPDSKKEAQASMKGVKEAALRLDTLYDFKRKEKSLPPYILRSNPD